MPDNLYYAPLGPYKEYAPGGEIGRLPEAPKQDNIFIDPRTGVHYGAYTEEEIMDDQATVLGMSVYNGLDPVEVARNRIVLENTMLPEEKQGTTDVIELHKNELNMGRLNMEAASLGHQALIAEEDDSAFLAEAIAKREEAQKLGELSITDNRGLTSEITRAMTNQLGLMQHMIPKAGPKVAIPLAIESVLNMGTPYKGFTATKFAGGAVFADYFNKQMRGDIYLSLRTNPDVEIDRDIAQKYANIFGTVSGASEALGLAGILKAAGLASDVTDRIVATAQEGGTEWIQSILEDSALWAARREQAERNGEEFTDDLMASIDFEKAQQGARTGILTAGGFAVPGAATKYSAAAVKAVQDADKKHIIRKQATELIRQYNEKQAELVDIEDKPTIPVSDPVTGQPIDAAPLDPVEVERADSVDGVSGTTVTDGEIDDFMLLDDPAEIDAAAERLVSSVNNIDDVFTADAFFNNLRSVLQPEEARFVEQIMNARADSAGVDINTYVSDRQIALKKAGYKEGVNAEVTFTEEGRAIIKAFTGANVSSVLHEVGHIFRRDLRRNDLAVVEKWAGVEPGGIWDVAAEEKFARAWERYLAEGKAPTQELIPAFNAFTKWITNIYKAIRGSEIDIEFDDGVRQVFDNLLVRQDQAKQQHEQTKQESMTLQQSTLHGTSQRDIDRIDHEYVRTGEGQVYFGWGTYSTQARSIAEGYRKADVRRKGLDRPASGSYGTGQEVITVDGKLVYDRSMHPALSRNKKKKTAEMEAGSDVAMRSGNFKAALDENKRNKETAERIIDRLGKDEAPFATQNLARANEIIPVLERWIKDGAKYQRRAAVKPERKELGQVYQLEIPEDEDMLSWYESVDTSDTRFKAIKKELGLSFPFGVSGKKLYNKITNAMSEPDPVHSKIADRLGMDPFSAEYGLQPSDKLASTYLDLMGYKGIKYPTGSLSGARPGEKSNYVVFNDENIDITDTFYQQRTAEEEQAVLAAEEEKRADQSAERISTAYPTAGRRKVDPTVELVEIGQDLAKQEPAIYAKNAAVINGNTWTDKKGNVFNTYPGFKTRKRDPDKITEEYIDFVVDNLLWIYDQVPDEIKQRSKLWYDGARHITDMWSERYDMQPHQVAGILASLSPQKDWYQNVSLAERVIDVVRAVDGTSTSIGTENKKFAIDLYRDAKGKIRKENRDLINQMIGVPYNELPSYLHRAAFVRVYDAMHNPKGYRIVTPEGAFIGEPQGRIGWGSNVEIEKAVKAFDAKSRDDINVIMGDASHKIRNFYNNIIAPNSGVDVTVDTHAKAALLLRPLSAKSFEVGHTFGGRGSGSSISGAYGLYGVDAEAYRRAAKDRQILPREMQSITWEAVRGLFEDTYKRTELNTAKGTKTGFTTADAIWKQYELGKITKEQARQEVLKHAGGFTKPTWYGLDPSVSEDFRGTSYEGGLSGYGVSERTTGPMVDGTRDGTTGGPTRLRQSRSGASEAELQAKYQRELLERTAARDTAIAAAEGKLNPSKTLAEQIKAHRREMRRLFAAGETEGAKNERNKIKVLLTRQKNRANVQKRHTAVRQQLIKLLADNLPKKISRKLQSGMDYDTQKIITELYNALMDENQDQQGIPFLPVKGGLNTVKGVNQMYYKYIEGAFINRPLTPVEVLRNEIITAAFMRNKFGLKALQDVYGQLGQLVRMGKKASPAMINLFKARELVKSATPQIVGDTNVDEATKGMDINEAHRQRQKQKSWRQKLATMKLGKDGLLAWGDLMELISAYSGEKPGDSVLLQQLDFFDSGQKKKTDIRTSMDRMIEGYREAYGIKTPVGMNRRQNLDLKRDINIGWNREVNRAQLRQIWMYMQDPSLNERLVYNGIEATQRQAVEREMTPEDRQFAQHLMNMFQDDSNYAATNEVYRRNFGVDLERFDNYVPLKAEPITSTQQALEADADTMSQFSQDKFLRRTPTSAGSLKGRAEDLWKSQLLFDGDLPLFQGWLEETAHFRAYADVVRLASSVVQDRDFRKAVIYEYGSGVYNTIMKNLKANAADDRANVEGINAVDRMRTAYVTSTIGMSTTVTMKQYISLLNFWQDMPFMDYVAGMASLPANMKLVQDIWKSDYLLNRKGNMDRDLKQAMRSKEYKRFMLNPSIKNFLTFNVTLGDSGAIALGGAVYVRYLMKQVNPRTGQKYTKAQAIHEMGRKADRTQQSGATEQLSEWQRGGSAMKILTTYSTGPVQATRQILAANRNLAAGKIGPAQYAKEMFIYQVAVPVMYSAAAGLVAGDDADEQLKNAMLAAILGPWGSTYFAGRALTAAARKAAGMSYFENSGPFTDTTMDIAGYANKIAEEGWDSLTLDQYARAVQSTLVLFGYGVPLTKVTRTIENAAEGDIAGAAFAANPNR